MTGIGDVGDGVGRNGGEGASEDGDNDMVGEGENQVEEAEGVEVISGELNGLETREGMAEGGGGDVVLVVGGEFGSKKGKRVAGLKYPKSIKVTISERIEAMVTSTSAKRVDFHSDMRKPQPQYRIS
jgi:hypothetical protein